MHIKLGTTASVLLIDALDECIEKDIRDLIEFFEDLGNSGFAKNIHFHVCFSSRHYPQVTLEKCQHLILDGQEGHQQDIAHYIESKLKLQQSRRASEIRATVQKRAESVFLWVVLVVRILNEDHDRGRVHKLRDRLKKIPDGLDDIFRTTLQRDGRNDDNVVHILQWIMYARRTLSREELYFAVNTTTQYPSANEPWNHQGTTPESMDLFILDCSRSLAKTNRDKRHTVQFIHELVRDHLADSGFRTLLARTTTNLLGRTHEYPKQCCLKWLTEEVVSQLSVAVNSTESLEALERMIASVEAGELFPLLEYAYGNAINHAELACQNGIEQSDFVASFPLQTFPRIGHLLAMESPQWFSAVPTSTYLFATRKAKNLLGTEIQLGAPFLMPQQHVLALRVATDDGNSEIMKLLLKRGDLRQASDQDQADLIGYAIISGRSEVLGAALRKWCEDTNLEVEELVGESNAVR